MVIVKCVKCGLEIMGENESVVREVLEAHQESSPNEDRS